MHVCRMTFLDQAEWEDLSETFKALAGVAVWSL